MATSRPASAFIRVDLPTLGGPAMTTSEAFAQTFRGRRRLRARDRSGPACRPRRLFDPSSVKVIGVLYVGKIDLRLDRSHRPTRRARMASPRDSARRRRSLGLSPLRLRFRIHQVGKPSTSVRSILPLTKARQANSPASADRGPGTTASASTSCGYYRAAPGDAHLRNVLAGETRRRLETGDQRPVKRFPRPPQMHGRPASEIGLPAQSPRDRRTAGAAKSADRDRRADDPGRRGEDLRAIARAFPRPARSAKTNGILSRARPKPARAWPTAPPAMLSRAISTPGVQTTYWSATASWSPCFSR